MNMCAAAAAHPFHLIEHVTKAVMRSPHADLYQLITDRIIAGIEADPDPWAIPWRTTPHMRRPTNVASGAAYRGINTVALWVEAQRCGYGSPMWGTYRQWSHRGGQVRKGAKATPVIFYNEVSVDEADAEADDLTARRRLILRSSPVFNADQVEGLEPEGKPDQVSPVTAVVAADAFVAKIGATIVHGGSRAYYSPKLDRIHMPARDAFVGSDQSSAAETYYSTLLHELTHWTGAPGRCDRDLGQRFGSEAYAMEELVAELGAAFLCADLGVSNEPRADHAHYLAPWLQVMKADKRAIFTAASKAAQAVSFLHARD